MYLKKHPEAHKNSKFKLIGGKPIAYIILAFFFFVLVCCSLVTKTEQLFIFRHSGLYFYFSFYKKYKTKYEKLAYEQRQNDGDVTNMTINNLNISL